MTPELLQITTIAISSLAIISLILLIIFMKKYEKSAMHITKVKDGIEITHIMRDPKWKKASLIAKAVTIILFTVTFILFIWYSTMFE